jgi:anti-anti-sigma factor
MDVTVADRLRQGATVVTLHGELGIDGLPQLNATLTDLIHASATRIVVDLARLTFCDSIGLSAFVDAHNRCTAAGGHLRLAAPAPFLLHVLAAVGLMRWVPVYDTVDAACTGDTTRLMAPPDGLRATAPRSDTGLHYL